MTGNDPLVTTAIGQFWGSRANQLANILNSQGGTRDAVVGGQHLNAMRDLLATVMMRAGAPPDAIQTAGRWVRAPGWYRPGKAWDLAVVSNGRLYALFELKSQVGSFGNNANNRAEEAIGSATDLAAAVNHQVLPERPYLGYVFLIEDAPKSHAATFNSPNLGSPPDPAFVGASYQQRLGLLAERMVADGLYDAAWVVASPKPATATSPVSWHDPNPAVGWPFFRDWLEMIVSDF